MLLAPLLAALLALPAVECPPLPDAELFPAAAPRPATDDGERVLTVTGLEVPELASLDATMRSYLMSTGVTRAGVAITKDGRLVFARGYTWAPAGVPATQPTTPFRIASCSKPLTSLALHRLMERGLVSPATLVAQRLDLETRPGNFRDPRLDAITVDHLLTHSGGWDRAITYDPLVRDGIIAETLGVPLPVSKHDVRVYMNGERLQFDPGDRFAYSNHGVALLGQLLEKTTGMAFPKAVRELVLAPLGLSRPRIGHSTREEAYPGESDYDDDFAYNLVNVETADAAGGWIAAAPDWARLFTVLEHPDANPLLSADSVAAMLDERWDVGRLGVARGWLRWTTPDGATAFGHDGALPGTSTSAYWRVDDHVGVVIFLNRSVTAFPALHQRVSTITAWPAHDLWASVGIDPAAAPREASEQWIAAAARADGAFGSRWTTSLDLVNRALLPNDIDVVAGGRSERVRLAPGGATHLDDLLGRLGLDGTAPVLLRGAEPFSAVSRTATAAPGGGSFGQSLDAEVPFEEMWRGDVGWLPLLAEDATNRTNVGLLNGGRRAARLLVTFHAPSGTELLRREVEVPPASLAVLGAPMAGVAPVPAAFARVEVLFGEWIGAYASRVDNRTNDPTTIPVLAGPGALRWTLPVAARADGDQGSRWSSDLGLVVTGAEPAAVRVAAADDPGTAVELAVPAGGGAVVDDLLGDLGRSGAVPLVVTSDRPVQLLSRTFTTSETGTYGQPIAAASDDALLGAGATALVPGVASDGSFRTNLLVANGGAAPAEVRLTLRDAAGADVGSSVVAVPPGAVRGTPVSSLFPEPLAGGCAVVEVLSGEGISVVGSLVDQRTNDPATLPARR